MRAAPIAAAPGARERYLAPRQSLRYCARAFSGESRIFRGGLSHKEFWLVDLASGAERQLTALGPGASIGDFDAAPDGSEMVFDRARDEADIVLIDLPR